MRIYFVSDIHGSTLCWRKFLAAARFYEADVIIVGGDITGKFVVPFIQQPDNTWLTKVDGVDRRLTAADEVEAYKVRIENAGSYSFETSPEEYEQCMADASSVDALFRRLVIDRVQKWVRLADEKLDGSGVQCFVSGGNDDFYEVDEALSTSRTIQLPEGRLTVIKDQFELLGLGYANITPWHCPRDISETDLAQKLQVVAEGVTDMERAIFDVHVPPYGSGLDMAPQLDSDLKVVMSASGEVQMIAVGSTAVRDAILKYQPMLAMHGHVHESRGVRRLGRTTIINPGSSYQEGVLQGAIINVHPRKGIRNTQLVAG